MKYDKKENVEYAIRNPRSDVMKCRSHTEREQHFPFDSFFYIRNSEHEFSYSAEKGNVRNMNITANSTKFWYYPNMKYCDFCTTSTVVSTRQIFVNCKMECTFKEYRNFLKLFVADFS